MATFHVLERYAERWVDVLPGDAIISPGSHFYRWDDFPHRNKDETHTVIVQKKPLIVLSRIDGDEAGPELTPPQLSSMFHTSTFIVYSITMGVLIGFRKTTPK